MSNWYVGAYWGPRDESVDQCADRLAELVTALSAIDPLLSSWRALGKSKREALAQPLVTADRADLIARLLADRNRREDNAEVIDQLGYSVFWWNGSDDSAAANLMMGCGATSTAVSNNAVVRLPDVAATAGLYGTSAARSIMHTLITVCNPDWAVWTSNDLCDKQREPDLPLEGGGYIAGDVVGHPAGWANYLSNADDVKFDSALLPASASVETTGMGTLVTLGDNPADPPLPEVLAVRVAMGYEVPNFPAEPSPSLAAPSSAGTTGVAPVARGERTDVPSQRQRSVSIDESTPTPNGRAD